MGLIEEINARIASSGILDYGISGGDILMLITIICTALLVRFIWCTIQDVRMFEWHLFLLYTVITSVSLVLAWERILEMPGSFTGIVLLIVMFWGARTWTAGR